MKIIRRHMHGLAAGLTYCYADGQGDGYGFGVDQGDDGYGAADGNGDPSGGGSGGGDGHGFFVPSGSSMSGSSGGGDGGRMVMSMVSEEARRSERVFCCPGCIGHYECSIHGRRL